MEMEIRRQGSEKNVSASGLMASLTIKWISISLIGYAGADVPAVDISHAWHTAGIAGNAMWHLRSHHLGINLVSSPKNNPRTSAGLVEPAEQA
jgi:hypothetical protein